MKSVGIVLVNYCGAKDTIECIRSIEKIKGNYVINIVVVDNNSPHDGVYDIINELGLCDELTTNFESNVFIQYSEERYTVSFICSNVNGGFGYANNIGIRYVKKLNCDVCILLNNDTVIPSDFLQKIDSFLLNKEFKCAFSVLSKYYSNHSQIDSEGYGYIDFYTGRTSHHKHYKTSYLVGSCIIMNSIKSVPYFDEHFFLYSEDVDYSFLLSENGYSMSFDPSNYFLHKVNASTSTNPNMEKIKIRSMIYLIKKRGTFMQFCVFCMIRLMYYLCNFRFSHFTFFVKNVWK